MKIGLGGLRYSPDVFWGLSFPEFMAAAEGYAESKGVGASARASSAPLTAAELEDLAEQYPDEPRH